MPFDRASTFQSQSAAIGKRNLAGKVSSRVIIPSLQPSTSRTLEDKRDVFLASYHYIYIYIYVHSSACAL